MFSKKYPLLGCPLFYFYTVLIILLVAAYAFSSSSFFALCSTASIVSCTEDLDDGKQVLAELLLW
jgi:hypothetical protein